MGGDCISYTAVNRLLTLPDIPAGNPPAVPPPVPALPAEPVDDVLVVPVPAVVDRAAGCGAQGLGNGSLFSLPSCGFSVPKIKIITQVYPCLKRWGESEGSF